MPNANYRRGVRLENLLKVQKERAGFSVTRSAGSKGVFDLVASNENVCEHIQVKAAGAASRNDLLKLAGAKVPKGCRKYLYERDGGTTEWKITEVR